MAKKKNANKGSVRFPKLDPRDFNTIPDHECFFIKPQPDNTGKTARTILMGHLKGFGVKILTEHKALRITDSAVVCADKEGNEITIPAETVVMAIGERPDASLYEQLKDELPEIYNIGDSNGGGILPAAVYEGYTVGNKI